jgi:hypothetical protein
MGASIFFTAAMIRACEVTWQWWVGDIANAVTEKGPYSVIKHN